MKVRNSLRTFLPLFTLSTTLAVTPTAVADDSAIEACEKAAELFTKDPEAGIKEAEWCLESYKKALQKISAALLPDDVMGFSGAKIRQQQALGFASTSRDYSQANLKIKATLTEGKSAGLLNQVGGYGGQKVRIEGIIGSLAINNSRITINLPMGDSNLSVETNSVEQDVLENFAKALVKHINNS